ncbi:MULTISPECIES: LuxR family transcriptional regulator [Bacteria]
MKKFSLTAIGRVHLDTARRVASGRSANTVYGGHEHVLRQTVIGLVGGQQLNEHLNPGEATVFVLQGRIGMATDVDHWDGRVGDLLIAPPGMYSVTAVEDSAVLLTVAKTDRRHGPAARDPVAVAKFRGSGALMIPGVVLE